ncbi:MAG: AAA family ATPase [Candidatus Lokiarchaeota archaeon]|nr:AAA family ATPase [Candidatus Lokiarchaeota archaeon]
MEIFNPSEWKLLNDGDTKSSKSIVQKFRERKGLKHYPFSPISEQTNRPFSKPIQLSSKAFNQLLKDGFKPGTVYLIYGAYATGKTQICMHACISLYKMYKENKDFISSLYIDTEGTFRPERIQEIASEGYGFEDTQVFTHIRVVRANSTSAINTMLRKIDSEGLDKEIKLIIIDSLTNYVRVDLGNDEISNIQVRDTLKKILTELREITQKYNIITILTSQVTGFKAEDSIFTDRSIMEYVLNHYTDELIYLQKEEDRRWANLVNSRLLPNRKIPFRITTSGIIDHGE